MEETLALMAEIGPFVGHRREPGVNKGLENEVILGQGVAKFDPIDGAVEFAANASEVAFINENDRPVYVDASMTPCRHAVFPL